MRKCEEQEENVFSILFSATQPNTRKYFPKHFSKIQPNTLKYFPFPKIAFPKNTYFLKNILHKPNTALENMVSSSITDNKIKTAHMLINEKASHIDDKCKT